MADTQQEEQMQEGKLHDTSSSPPQKQQEENGELVEQEEVSMTFEQQQKEVLSEEERQALLHKACGEQLSVAVTFATKDIAPERVLELLDSCVREVQASRLLYGMEEYTLGEHDILIAPNQALKPVSSKSILNNPQWEQKLSQPWYMLLCAVCLILGLASANAIVLWYEYSVLEAVAFFTMIIACTQSLRHHRARIKLLSKSFDFWYLTVMLGVFVLVSTTGMVRVGARIAPVAIMAVPWYIGVQTTFLMTDASAFAIKTRIRLMLISIAFFISLLITTNKYLIAIYGDDTNREFKEKSIDFLFFSATLNGLMYSCVTPLALFVIRYGITAAYYRRPFNIISAKMFNLKWESRRLLTEEEEEAARAQQEQEPLTKVPTDVSICGDASQQVSPRPAPHAGVATTATPEDDGGEGQNPLKPPMNCNNNHHHHHHQLLASDPSVIITDLLEEDEDVAGQPRRVVQASSPPRVTATPSGKADGGNVDEEKSKTSAVAAVPVTPEKQGDVSPGTYQCVCLSFTTPLLDEQQVLLKLHDVISGDELKSHFVRHVTEKYHFAEDDEVLGACEAPQPVTILPLLNNKAFLAFASSSLTIGVSIAIATVGVILLLGSPWLKRAGIDMNISTLAGALLLLLVVTIQALRYTRGHIVMMFEDFQFWYVAINGTVFMTVCAGAYNVMGVSLWVGIPAAAIWVLLMMVTMSVDASPFSAKAKTFFVFCLFIFFLFYSVSMSNFMMDFVWSTVVTDFFRAKFSVGPADTSPAAVSVGCGTGAALYLLKFMLRLSSRSHNIVYTDSPIMDATNAFVRERREDDFVEEVVYPSPEELLAFEDDLPAGSLAGNEEEDQQPELGALGAQPSMPFSSHPPSIVSGGGGNDELRLQPSLLGATGNHSSSVFQLTANGHQMSFDFTTNQFVKRSQRRSTFLSGNCTHKFFSRNPNAATTDSSPHSNNTKRRLGSTSSSHQQQPSPQHLSAWASPQSNAGGRVTPGGRRSRRTSQVSFAENVE